MIRPNRRIAVGVIGAAIVAVSACDTDRAITSVPAGELAFGTTLSVQNTNLPRGTVTFATTPIASATPATDSIIITLAGLDSLTRGVYAVWVGNDSGSVFRRLSGNLVVTRVDTTLNAQGDPVNVPNVTTRTGVSSFAVGGQNYAFRFAGARTGISGIANTDSANVVLVTVETSATATTPGSRRFLWARRSEASATTRIALLRFGNFAPRIADQFVYAVNGVSPIVPRGRASVRGRSFVIVDSNLFRPPVGFYYAAWAIRFDTLGFQQLNNSVYLGRSTTPFPDRQSLYDADSTIVDPDYVLDRPRVILAAANRVTSDTIAALSARTEMFWRDFGRVIITLENKAAAEGVRPGPAIVLTGVLPASIRGR